MFVCIDARGFATAWNYDGSLPNVVPEGSTVVDVPPAQFAVLRAIRGRRVTFNGTAFVHQTASAEDLLRALLEVGWYDDAVAAVNSLTGPEAKLVKVLWARTATFKRNQPFLLQIAAAMGKTSADLDALFIRANSYPE